MMTSHSSHYKLTNIKAKRLTELTLIRSNLTSFIAIIYVFNEGGDQPSQIL